MDLLYILNAQDEPEPCDDAVTWALWMESADRRVAQDLDEGDGDKRIWVSTVFLGLNPAPLGVGGTPRLWETMVFGGLLDGTQQRYTSKADALRGHQAICQRVTETIVR